MCYGKHGRLKAPLVHSIGSTLQILLGKSCRALAAGEFLIVLIYLLRQVLVCSDCAGLFKKCAVAFVSLCSAVKIHLGIILSVLLSSSSSQFGTVSIFNCRTLGQDMLYDQILQAKKFQQEQKIVLADSLIGPKKYI